MQESETHFLSGDGFLVKSWGCLEVDEAARAIMKMRTRAMKPTVSWMRRVGSMESSLRLELFQVGEWVRELEDSSLEYLGELGEVSSHFSVLGYDGILR